MYLNKVNTICKHKSRGKHVKEMKREKYVYIYIYADISNI